MKKTMIMAAAFIAGVLTSSAAFAQNVGFVDMVKLEQKMTAYQGVVSQRDKVVKAYTKRFEEIEASLKAKEAGIAAEREKLSQAEVGKRIDALRVELETYKQQREEFAKQMQDALLKSLKEIQDKAVTPVLKEIAKENGYTAILNLNQALYVDPKNDVTDEVITKVNAKLPKVEMPKINISAKK